MTALDGLRRFGAQPVKERFMRGGKVTTAAVVSAGIDMALALVALKAGEAAAPAAHLMIEYDPRPPFDSGSPDRAPAEIVERPGASGVAKGLLDSE